LVIVRFEPRASCLLGNHNTPWATTPALFPMIIFEIWSHILAWAQPQTVIPLPMPPSQLELDVYP
jgi:hypothetical protein